MQFAATATLAERTINPHWIIDALRAGTNVSIYDGFILEPLEAELADLPGSLLLVGCLVKGIRFNGSVLRGELRFLHCWFGEVVQLDRTTVHGKASFEFCTARRGIRAERAVLHEGLMLQGVRVRYFYGTGLVCRADLIFGDVTIVGAFRLDESELQSLTIIKLRVGPKSRDRKPTDADAMGGYVRLATGTNFENARIRGNFRATECHFKSTLVALAVEVQGQTFIEQSGFAAAAFGHAKFAQSLVFMSCAFNAITILNGCVVESHLRFVSCTFLDEFHGSALDARSQASFSGCIFEGRVLLERISVEGGLDLFLLAAKKDFRLISSRIGGDLALQGCQFDAVAAFDYAKISGFVEIRDAMSGAKLLIGNYPGPTITAYFAGLLSFSHAEVGGDLRIAAQILSSATFAETAFASSVQLLCNVGNALTLTNATVTSSVDLSQSVVRGKLMLDGSTFGELKLSSSLTEKRDDATDVLQTLVAFDATNCSFDRLQARWQVMLQKQDPFSIQPFMQVERLFRRLGMSEWADLCYLSGKRGLAARETRAIRRIGNFFADLIYGYGVKPWRALGFAILVPVLGALAFAVIPGAARPISVQSTIYRCNANPDVAHGLWLAFRAYVPADVQPHGSWIVSDCLQGSALGLMLKLLGIVFLPLAVAALTGLLKKASSSE